MLFGSFVIFFSDGHAINWQCTIKHSRFFLNFLFLYLQKLDARNQLMHQQKLSTALLMMDEVDINIAQKMLSFWKIKDECQCKFFIFNFYQSVYAGILSNILKISISKPENFYLMKILTLMWCLSEGSFFHFSFLVFVKVFLLSFLEGNEIHFQKFK